MKKIHPCLQCTLVPAALLLGAAGALAQEGPAGAGGPVPVESHTILQTILGGGPLIILIWLAILPRNPM